jgi:hypothetical protein
MKKWCSVLLSICLLCVSFQSTLAEENEAKDVFGDLLAQYGYQRSDIDYESEILDYLTEMNAEMVLPWFTQWWKNPLDVHKNASGVFYSISEGWNVPSKEYKNTGLFQLFLGGMVRTGHVVMYLPEIKMQPFPIDPEEPLLDGIKHVYAANGYMFSEHDAQAVRKMCDGMPIEIQAALADFLYSSTYAARCRDRALRKLPKEQWYEAYQKISLLAKGDGIGKEIDDLIWDLGPDFDYKPLYEGTIYVMYSIFKIQKAIRDEGHSWEGSFDYITPLGKIAFSGDSGSNEYRGDDYFLIVDCGGDDTYTGATAATATLDRPVSVVIDFAGDDTYIADEHTNCAQGSGTLGIGILVDEQGNDTYTVYDNGQGSATFGVGILWDGGGDDSFSGRVFCQGAAQFGVGELINIGGNDTYYAFYSSQAFANTAGYGLLLDTEGNDTYTAEPYKLMTPGVHGHNDNVNYSLCQGVGFGRRADLYDGHSMGGGMGVLVDLAGDDVYTAGIYAQASAYWFAAGLLYDKAGNDIYDAYFFVQSGTAHMGITELLDDEGDDFYKARQAISVGGAHDISISWAIDRGGNDHYECWYEDADGNKTSGGLLLGASTANGMGFCINIGGDDIYDVLDEPNKGQTSIGFAQHRVNNESASYRNTFPDVGIFIDIGGNDTYSRPICKDNTSWKQESDRYPRKMSIGLGLDIDDGWIPELKWQASKSK